MPIVCGIDFSEHSQTAATVAAAFAARLGESVRLIHVKEPVSFREGLKPEVSAIANAMNEALGAEAERLRSLGATVDERSLAGIPDEELVQAAYDVKAPLLVIGALGRRSALQWLLGSVAERIMKTAGVPVLIARDATAFTAWGTGKRALRVMVGIDACETSDAALRWTARLRNGGPCQIIAAHIYYTHEELRRLALQRSTPFAGAHSEVERVLARDLTPRVAAVLGDQGWSLMLRNGAGRLSAHLVQLAEEQKVDLLVVGTHQRSGLDRLRYESTAYDAARIAQIAVACVPVAAPAEAESQEVFPVRTVVAASDMSPAANRAVAYAYSLVTGGGTVHLLHVIEDGHSSGRARQSDEGSLRASLQALAPRRAELDRVDTEVEILHAASAGEAIAAYAERVGAELICLGSQAPGKLSRAFGSVARSVMTHTRRPVLLVQSPSDCD